MSLWLRPLVFETPVQRRANLLVRVLFDRRQAALERADVVAGVLEGGRYRAVHRRRGESDDPVVVHELHDTIDVRVRRVRHVVVPFIDDHVTVVRKFGDARPVVRQERRVAVRESCRVECVLVQRDVRVAVREAIQQAVDRVDVFHRHLCCGVGLT